MSRGAQASAGGPGRGGVAGYDGLARYDGNRRTDESPANSTFDRSIAERKKVLGKVLNGRSAF